MTGPVQQILDAFDHLPEAEQREAASAILRRTLRYDLPTLEDETLIEIAEEIFSQLDAREAADEGA